MFGGIGGIDWLSLSTVTVQPKSDDTSIPNVSSFVPVFVSCNSANRDSPGTGMPIGSERTSTNTESATAGSGQGSVSSNSGVVIADQESEDSPKAEAKVEKHSDLSPEQPVVERVAPSQTPTSTASFRTEKTRPPKEAKEKNIFDHNLIGSIIKRGQNAQ